MRSLLATLIVLSAVACAATNSVQKVPMPDLTASAVDPAKARVFLFREDQTFGQAWNVVVSLSSLEIGDLAAGNYLCFDVDPGLRQFILVLDRARFTGPPIRAAVPQEFEGGRTYYGSVSFDKVRAAVDVKLTFLTEAAGRERLADLTPAAIAQ